MASRSPSLAVTKYAAIVSKMIASVERPHGA
jgi:hypothetical protein